MYTKHVYPAHAALYVQLGVMEAPAVQLRFIMAPDKPYTFGEVISYEWGRFVLDVESQKRDWELVLRTRSGDVGAEEELVDKYMPMVKHIVRKHYASFLDFDDLCQEGLIGFLHAVRTYDAEAYDAKFSSFAYMCILRKVYNAIKRTNGLKHRALNEALSLNNAMAPDESRTLLDSISSGEPLDDPVESFEVRWKNQRIKEVLYNHLSLLEYTVIAMMLAGYGSSEIQVKLGVNGKVVDNARTRVRAKLRRLIETHGSLISPAVPKVSRRREDLSRSVQVMVT